MDNKEDNFKQTKETYQKLGKKYLNNIKDVYPADLNGFMELLKPGGRVLDVGCAGGRDSKRFAENGFEVVGVDVTEKFIKEARKNVPEGTFHLKDVRHFDFPKNYFDGIWAHAVLLHIDREEAPEVLNKFYKTLKSGGMLHVRTKNGKGCEVTRKKISSNQARRFVYYAQDELEKLTKEAGFKIIESGVYQDELGRKDTQWVKIWAKKINV